MDEMVIGGLVKIEPNPFKWKPGIPAEQRHNYHAESMAPINLKKAKEP
jgi:hypothetical protein